LQFIVSKQEWNILLVRLKVKAFEDPANSFYHFSIYFLPFSINYFPLTVYILN